MGVIGCDNGKFYVSVGEWSKRKIFKADVGSLVAHFKKHGVPEPFMCSSSIDFSEEDGVNNAHGIINEALSVLKREEEEMTILRTADHECRECPWESIVIGGLTFCRADADMPELCPQEGVRPDCPLPIGKKKRGSDE